MTSQEGPAFGRTRTAFILSTVFIAGAAVMAIEILGSRVLGPFFGATLYVWAALITVALVALAVGYFAGGRLADGRPHSPLIETLTFAAALAAAAIPVLRVGVLEWTGPLGAVSGAFVATLLLFSPVLFALGMVTPMAIRLSEGAAEKAGSRSGTILALSTMGGVSGSLLSAFVLIPHAGVRASIGGISGLLALTAAVGFALGRRWARATASAALMILSLGLAVRSRPPSISAVVSEGIFKGPRVLYNGESFYGRIRVVDSGRYRLLMIDAYAQSMVDRSTGESGYAYVRAFGSLRPILSPSARSALLVGGGAGHIASELAAQGLRVDMVEVDGKILDVARKYFGFQERGEVFVEDGRSFLNRTDRVYDLIVLDAYAGGWVPAHLASRECFLDARRVLKGDGLLAVNWVSTGRIGAEQASVYRTLRDVFPSVRVHRLESSGLANFLYLASAAAGGGPAGDGSIFTPENDVTAEIVAMSEGEILTDDRNRTDLLQTPKAEAFRNTMVRLLGESVFLD
ncbi:MAG: fused MFS/spermidine synthase [Nitrospirae bacterium]|nr:fused MFS/spermidine synthase [Nitrospirota bacterium]